MKQSLKQKALNKSVYIYSLPEAVPYITLSLRFVPSGETRVKRCAQGQKTVFQKNLKSSNLQPFGNQPRSLTAEPQQCIHVLIFGLIQVQLF